MDKGEKEYNKNTRRTIKQLVLTSNGRNQVGGTNVINGLERQETAREGRRLRQRRQVSEFEKLKEPELEPVARSTRVSIYRRKRTTTKLTEFQVLYNALFENDNHIFKNLIELSRLWISNDTLRRNWIELCGENILQQQVKMKLAVDEIKSILK